VVLATYALLLERNKTTEQEGAIGPHLSRVYPAILATTTLATSVVVDNGYCEIVEMPSIIQSRLSFLCQNFCSSRCADDVCDLKRV
jgi:hypothetical protein